MKIAELEHDVDVHVVRSDSFKYDLLIGLDVIKQFKLIQDENLQIWQRVGRKKRRVPLAANKVFRRTGSNRKRPLRPEKVLSESELKEEILVNFNEHIDVNQFEAKISHIEDEQKRRQILKVIHKYSSIFARNKFDVGRVKSHEAEIKLQSDRFVSSRPYRCSQRDRNEIEKQIKNLLAAGLIEESTSPFSSPVTLVFKKEDGSRTRLCIDFRNLNKLVIPESQPFPRIEDLIDRLAECEYFTVLDINSAFWSIPLKLSDREKTSFVTEEGHYQWTSLPFGLKNASSIFQRILANIIRRNGLSANCVNYLDDILIFSKSWEEHLQHIEQFLTACQSEGFKLKLTKCEFATDSVKYLGHLIQKNKVLPLQDNLISIKEFPTPKNRRNIKQFLGKVNYYQKFIENCSQKLEPLHQLLRKNVAFVWSRTCQQSFDEMRKYLTSQPVLQIYNPNKMIYIYSDACTEGIGAVLKQQDESGVLHPIAYFSKKLTPSQRKKPIIYLETLAIKECITFWQHYLIGREFVVVTDHKPIENLRVKAKPNEPLGELVNYLSQFDFKIVYQRGKDNIEADALSRNAVLLETFESEEKVQTANLIELQEILDDQRKNPNHGELVNESRVLVRTINGRRRIAISQQLGKEIAERVHKKFGHLGPSTIAEMIRELYYFKNFDQILENVYRNCIICAKMKSRTIRKAGFLDKFGPPKRPFEIMSLDSVGGFAGNKSVKKYLHILIDHFTRYCWIIASKTQSAADFVNLLRPIVEKYKVDTLLADQYTANDSERFVSFMAAHGVQVVFTAIDHASSNGMVERVGQTLVNRIRCKINEPANLHKSWATIAKECTEEYNKTTHTVTRFAPNYLLFGQKTNLCPIDLIVNDLEKDRKLAFENSSRNFEFNKKRVDRVKKDRPCGPGDWVMVKRGSKLNRGKLEAVRDGPFRVEKKLSNLMYLVKAGRRKANHNVFHRDQLVPISLERPLGGAEM